MHEYNTMACTKQGWEQPDQTKACHHVIQGGQGVAAREGLDGPGVGEPLAAPLHQTALPKAEHGRETRTA